MWSAEHRYPGLISVPVSALEQPPDTMRSRPLTPANVRHLRDWIEDHGNDTGASPFIVVSFFFGHKAPPKQISTEQCKQIFGNKLFVASGSHRTEAFKQLSATWPLNRNWQNVMAQVIFCANTAQNHRSAKSLGMLANMCADQHMAPSLADKLEFIYERVDLELAQNGGKPLSDAQVNGIRSETWEVCGGSASTHKAVCQLATRDAELRPNVRLIVRGQHGNAVVPSKSSSFKGSKKKGGEAKQSGKLMTHPSQLVHLGGVSVAQQLEWLDLIVNGELPLCKLPTRAKNDKAMLLIRKYICKKTNIDDWKDVSKRFHTFTDNWVSQFVPQVMKAKAPTENLIAVVDTIIMNVKKVNQLFKVL